MIVTKHISFQPVLRQGMPRIPGDPGYHQLLRSDGSFDSAAHLEKSNHTKSDGDWFRNSSFRAEFPLVSSGESNKASSVPEILWNTVGMGVEERG